MSNWCSFSFNQISRWSLVSPLVTLDELHKDSLFKPLAFALSNLALPLALCKSLRGRPAREDIREGVANRHKFEQSGGATPNPRRGQLDISFRPFWNRNFDRGPVFIRVNLEPPT